MAPCCWHIYGFYMKVYLDGSLDTTKVVCGILGYPACPALMVSSNGGYDIGRHRGNNTYAFDGYIDDVRIFGEAFTQTQIQQLYAEGLPSQQNLAKK